MYTMKETCEKTGMTYEGLKFYCNEGLVPNVKRNKNNRRVFDDRNIGWLKGLMCLRRCGMSMKDMKIYMEYCLQGKKSIPERKVMLVATREELLSRMKELQDALDYIDGKQSFYDDVMAGKAEYHSNLVDFEE